MSSPKKRGSSVTPKPAKEDSPIKGTKLSTPDEVVAQLERLVTNFRRFSEMVVQPDSRVRNKDRLSYKNDESPPEKLYFALRQGSRMIDDEPLYGCVLQHTGKAISKCGYEQRQMVNDSLWKMLIKLQSLEEKVLPQMKQFVQEKVKEAGGGPSLLKARQTILESGLLDLQAMAVHVYLERLTKIQHNYFEQQALACEQALQELTDAINKDKKAPVSKFTTVLG